MTRWRYTYRGKPAGPWRESKRQAQQDAVNAGEASWDEHVKDRLYPKPFAAIEEERD